VTARRDENCPLVFRDQRLATGRAHRFPSSHAVHLNVATTQRLVQHARTASWEARVAPVGSSEWSGRSASEAEGRPIRAITRLDDDDQTDRSEASAMDGFDWLRAAISFQTIDVESEVRRGFSRDGRDRSRLRRPYGRRVTGRGMSALALSDLTDDVDW
jgi:hypothetical protein